MKKECYNIVVYDFDKTLTRKDTLLGFFSMAADTFFAKVWKIPLYITCMVLARLHIISNTRLKETGVRLFLKGRKEEDIARIGRLYAQTIDMNRLYHKMISESHERCFVVSASFQEYIVPLFPSEVVVVASGLQYRNGLVSGLATNCYGEKKREMLQQRGIMKIDLLYTDSYSDFALAEISDKIVIVDRDRYTEVHNLDAFKGYFNK